MDKNIKNIISEAFNELYDEMVNEAPAQLANNSISERERKDILEKAKKTGRGPSWDKTVNEESQDNFNWIIDELIKDYNDNKSPTRENSKKAIQTAFIPLKTGGNNGRPNKMYTSAGKFYITDPGLQDAQSSAFEQILIKGFDNLLKNYRMDNGFSAIVLKGLRNRIQNYISRGYGDGISKFDPMGGGYDGRNKIGSMDVDTDDGHGFHDTYGGSDSKESSMDISKRDAQTKLQKTMLKSLNNWILDKHESGAMSKKAYIAVSEILNGTSPKLIPATYPEMNWKGSGAPTTIFNAFKDSKLGAEASQYISNLFNTNFSTSRLNHLKLAQQSSQGADFNINATDNEVGSEEMLSILGQINDITKELGYTANYKTTTDIPNRENIENWAKDNFKNEDGEPKDWGELSKSERKKAEEKVGWAKLKKVFEKLESQGKEEEIDTIKWMVRDLDRAKEYDKNKGGYGSPRTYLHKGDDAKEFSGLYEGVKPADIEKLMERVFRRLRK